MIDNQQENQSSSQVSRKRSHSEIGGDEDFRFHLSQADHNQHKGKPSTLVPESASNGTEIISTSGNGNSAPATESRTEEIPTKQGRKFEKSHKHVVNELYVNLVSEMMYPKIELSSYGYEPEKNRYPFDRVNTLGYLLNPLRNRSVFEKWSPFEISVFEASITLYGKNFHTIQKNIETKTVKEIIEFYYEWKKTNHYKEWKKQYFPDLRDFE